MLLSMGRATMNYVALMKPRIIILLLINTIVAMWVATSQPIPLALVAGTMVAGALSAGAANALNCFIDRDIDAVMSRTQRRPVPAGRVAPTRALVFGVVTGTVSFFLMWSVVNLLAAVLSVASLLFYVVIYTLWLKRSTPQNIVIGGAAGAMPPVIGWAAVTGRVEIPALVLFAIVFLWTPPHFWALALLKKEDYARAGVPMLPVSRGETETRRQIFWYTLLLVAVSLVLVPMNVLGTLYLVSALALGALFIWLAVRVKRDQTLRAARGLFGYSIVYLTLLFAAMVVDRWW